jgi:hypothetical protein
MCPAQEQTTLNIAKAPFTVVPPGETEAGPAAANGAAHPSESDDSSDDSGNEEGEELDAFTAAGIPCAALDRLLAALESDPAALLRPSVEVADLARGASKALYDYGVRALAASDTDAAKADASSAGGAKAPSAPFLPELYTEGFDPEQIWAQVEGASGPALKRARILLRRAAGAETLISPDVEEAIDGKFQRGAWLSFAVLIAAVLIVELWGHRTTNDGACWILTNVICFGFAELLGGGAGEYSDGDDNDDDADDFSSEEDGGSDEEGADLDDLDYDAMLEQGRRSKKGEEEEEDSSDIEDEDTEEEEDGSEEEEEEEEPRGAKARGAQARALIEDDHLDLDEMEAFLRQAEDEEAGGREEEEEEEESGPEGSSDEEFDDTAGLEDDSQEEQEEEEEEEEGDSDADLEEALDHALAAVGRKKAKKSKKRARGEGLFVCVSCFLSSLGWGVEASVLGSVDHSAGFEPNLTK